MEVKTVKRDSIGVDEALVPVVAEGKNWMVTLRTCYDSYGDYHYNRYFIEVNGKTLNEIFENEEEAILSAVGHSFILKNNLRVADNFGSYAYSMLNGMLRYRD